MWTLALSLMEGIAMSVLSFFVIYIGMKMEGEFERLSVRDDLLSWIACCSPCCTILVMGMNDLICNHNVVAFLAIMSFVAPIIIADQFSKKKKEVEKAQNRINELEQIIRRQDKEISEMKTRNGRL